MKVGIITFNRAHNYGAVLQCYALQTTIKKLGHDVEVINYKQPFTEHVYSAFSLKRLFSLRRHPKSFVKYLITIPQRLKLKSIYARFRKKYLNESIESDSTFEKDYDIYVVGSDQLWTKSCLGGDFDNVYLGLFQRPKDSRLIAYAISATTSSLEDLLSDSSRNSCIKGFNSLSVREECMKELLDNNQIDSHVDLDPTLLLEETDWHKLVSPYSKFGDGYILVYYVLRYGKGVHEKMLQHAHKMARMYKCKVVDLTYKNCEVSDFVTAFKYARCVITSSFHGVVFSTIFEKPLKAVMLNDHDDSRSQNLINKLSIPEALCTVDMNMNIPSINYSMAKDNLLELRRNSLNYLKQNL